MFFFSFLFILIKQQLDLSIDMHIFFDLLRIETNEETKIQKLMATLDNDLLEYPEEFQRAFIFITGELIMGEVNSIIDGSCSIRKFTVWALLWSNFEAIFGELSLSYDQIIDLQFKIWNWPGLNWEK